ncbi:DUF1501 domain-containing protein [Agrilutibacter solisilvae]|uniref:DUF1501 domain-containing protein n=1 Tax=Agrilutibacter solisilvae TaxID=2763317 RepID=A0A974Y4U6_9GAMM|nr:DUF1501 domain-containing protein [Lysobacter solisilvae]QSX78136.1 DUF1501 domain-containing protein [Lysobacter solisilvae]
MSFSRREFLKGCCASTVLGAGGKPLMIFAGDAGKLAANPHDTIVHVFLRGGIDGLNLVVPIDGVDRGHYEQARPNLAIDASGTYGALPLTLANGAATGFGLHPSATGLRDLWAAQRMAIVHGSGLPEATRSHFDAQLYIDLGTPGAKGGNSGWMTRAWNMQPGATGTENMPSLGVNSRQPVSLLGSTKALVMADPDDFALDSGAWAWQRTRGDSPAGLRGVNETLAAMWAGQTPLEISGQGADRALKVIATQPYGTLPAGWPTGGFAQQLWTVAQSIQFNLGLRYATLDLGGWDTHDGQGTAGSGWNYYQNKISELSAALTAFHAALDASGHIGRVTVVVQSEFGRRVRANAAGGTDHGYGNPLLVLGGPVNGRRFYGTWSGLDPEVLSPYYGDVPVTTDYRRVLSELLVRRMGNPYLGHVFPGYAGYSPLGIVQGTDLAIKSGLHPATAAPSAIARPGRRALPVHRDDALERFWKFLQFLMSRV